MSNVVIEDEVQAWSRPIPPPPLPPHAAPPKAPVEEYRPPVPPHRNMQHHQRASEAELDQSEETGEEEEVEGRPVFQFDDEPAAEFVANVAPPRSRTVAEVKRATVVGNPMCRTNQASENEPEGVAPGELPDHLGVDYDQIMRYFDNLKESNA
uniref:Uncharacterized protein n=2 Tax=Dendroctonus ponderosae TaxID=77166 RepID=A0AAR5PLA1_DENPD